MNGHKTETTDAILQNVSCIMRNAHRPSLARRSPASTALRGQAMCFRTPTDKRAREKAPSGVKVGTGAGSVEPQYSGAPW